MYSSIETLPMKIFLKISKTGDISLLGDGEKEDHIKAWENIIEEYKGLDPEESFNKILQKHKILEYTICSFRSTDLALFCLTKVKDEKLLKILASKGYRIRDDSYYEDIKTCKRHLIAEEDRIKELQKELIEDTNVEDVNFDKVIIRYNVIMGFNIAKPSEVTVSEYFAIKEEVQNKQKALQKQKQQ
jgi:hypothetical protein